MDEALVDGQAAKQTLQVGRSSWTWRAGHRSGAAVVSDLDGVLSNAESRQHLVTKPRSDWEAFFAAAAYDPVIGEAATLLELLAPALGVVLLTARPARTRDLTLDWLQRHRVRWDLLVMRRDGDYRPARNFKQGALVGIRAQGFDVRLCLEDDLRSVEMFRDEGIPVLYIHSGYYS
jgi:hypothetical protein